MKVLNIFLNLHIGHVLPRKDHFCFDDLERACHSCDSCAKSRSSEIALNITLSLQSKQVVGDKAERRTIGRCLFLLLLDNCIINFLYAPEYNTHICICISAQCYSTPTTSISFKPLEGLKLSHCPHVCSWD